jgi:hypothetical protein
LLIAFGFRLVQRTDLGYRNTFHQAYRRICRTVMDKTALREKIATPRSVTKRITLTALCEDTSLEGLNLLPVEDNTGPYAESDPRIPRTLYY